MSTFKKEIYDYELIEKCSKCENVSLKSNFHKDKTKHDGLYSHCKSYNIQKQKEEDLNKRDKKMYYLNT